jgi:transposase
MPKTRPPYPPEFRTRLVELVRSGRKPEELAREFEPSAQSIRNWVRESGVEEDSSSEGASIVDREELQRLRRENRQLREEREILSKAAAWFAREANSIPPRSSDS